MLANAGLHDPPFRQLHKVTVGDNDAELLFESVTRYFRRKSVLLINQVTLPVFESTVSSVPFASIVYIRLDDVLLEARIWKLITVLNVTFSLDGPWIVGGKFPEGRKNVLSSFTYKIKSFVSPLK